MSNLYAGIMFVSLFPVLIYLVLRLFFRSLL